jgi:hypothetical protein
MCESVSVCEAANVQGIRLCRLHLLSTMGTYIGPPNRRDETRVKTEIRCGFRERKTNKHTTAPTFDAAIPRPIPSHPKHVLSQIRAYKYTVPSPL